MQNVEHNGLSLKLYPLHGEVVKIDQTTTTSISSNGGGSHTDLEGKFTIRPMSISSQTNYEREVWIKDMNGKEHTIMLNNKSIKLREGNLITVGLFERGNRQTLISLKNHATEYQHSFSSSDALVTNYNISTLSDEMGVFKWLLLSVTTGVGLFFFVGHLARETSFGDLVRKLPEPIAMTILLGLLGIGSIVLPLSIFIYGFRRNDRAHRNHNEAIDKIKEARKIVMEDPHPALSN